MANGKNLTAKFAGKNFSLIFVAATSQIVGLDKYGWEKPLNLPAWFLAVRVALRERNLQTFILSQRVNFF